MSKKIDEMEHDDLVDALEIKFHFTKDEIKVLFPSDGEMRDALRTGVKLRKRLGTKAAENLGWDSTDKTLLTKAQKDEIAEVTRAKRNVVKAEDSLIEKQIEATKAPLSVEEIRQARRDLSIILGDTEDDE